MMPTLTLIVANCYGYEHVNSAYLNTYLPTIAADCQARAASRPTTCSTCCTRTTRMAGRTPAASAPIKTLSPTTTQA
jgi:hypothetical protein